MLNCRHLKQSLHLISNAPCLGVRGLGHVTQQHCHRHDVLARSREAADRLFRLPVPDDLSMYLFVKFCLELSQLRELHGSIFLWRGVDLSVIPRSPRVLSCCRGSTTSNGVLCLVGCFYRPVDMEAFPSRVAVVVLRAGVRIGGIEASTSFL